MLNLKKLFQKQNKNWIRKKIIRIKMEQNQSSNWIELNDRGWKLNVEEKPIMS